MTDLDGALSQEIEHNLLPLLSRLRQTGIDTVQASRLIDILEINLNRLARMYGGTFNTVSVYGRLTPVETVVASMIRQGLTTKDIADALSIAPGTVSIHRKHIRKKLGLGHKNVNLQSYLKSLS